jgi:hypothetical protein
MNSLPSTVNYAEAIPSLPENAIRYSVALQPVNGAEFLPTQQIQFQYPNRGYLIPDSVYLRYKLQVVNNAGTAAKPIGIPGTPFFTPFQRLETQFGSVTVDSINNYHQVCNMLTNTTMDWAQKYGNAFNYGYSPISSSTTAATTEEMDGYLIAADGAALTTNLSLAGPLPCLLTNITDKLLPLFAMPTISQVLTIDNISNIIYNAGNHTVLTHKITNCELCFDFVELGSDVDAMVRGMGPKLFLKSQSFSNAAVTVPASSSGSMSFIFNQRYASCKGAFVLFSGSNIVVANNAGNGLFDARDITTNSGSISINISGVSYPQKPYSMVNNKAAMLIELRKVMGSIYDKNNSLAINSREFSCVDATVTEVNVPGKFYVGFNLQKLHSNALLTGISTNNSNITVQLESSTPVGALNRQCNLILAYDALIEIDMVSKQASVKC